MTSPLSSIRIAGRSAGRSACLAAGLVALGAPAGASGHELPGGTWYLDANGQRLTLKLDCARGGMACSGTIADEAAPARTDVVDRVSWDRERGELALRRMVGTGGWTWYRGRVSGGVIVGRWAIATPDGAAPGNATLYTGHVTGWNRELCDARLTPRVFDLLLDGNDRATLRIDRDPAAPGSFVGTLKVYASISDVASMSGAGGEAPLHEATIDYWDGERLEFSVVDTEPGLRFAAEVRGRLLAGLYLDERTGRTPRFTGARAEVLTHGLAGGDESERAAWQARARAALENLMMDGNPRPLSFRAIEVRSDLAPFPLKSTLSNRDDGVLACAPRRYLLTELEFDSTLPGAHGGAPLRRRGHGWLARPTTPPPAGGHPTIVVLNGHMGSAAQLLQPDNPIYWYGESYASHGFLVLALDVGHRPVDERRGVYGQDRDIYANGDDVANGNGLHPAIRAAGLDSDWQEDGERAWDVMRAMDYLQSRPDVDHEHVIITGLSMGGEMTTFAAALDPRFAMAIPVGFSPDWNVLYHLGSHGCWQWAGADIGEYIDPSDLHALIAPRPLLVETGAQDYIYSTYVPPFASDKQVLRRTRAYYADHPNQVIHYLHSDGHAYHFGGFSLAGETGWYVRQPLLTAPTAADVLDWQTDAATVESGGDLYGAIRRLLWPPPGLPEGGVEAPVRRAVGGRH